MYTIASLFKEAEYGIPHPNFVNFAEDNKVGPPLAEIKKVAAILKKASTFDARELDWIGRQESQIKDLFFQPFRNALAMDEVYHLYAEYLHPLLKNSQQFLIQRQMHKVVVAAAEKGKAFQAGMRIMKWCIENNDILEPLSTHATHDRIFLVPQAQAVLKVPYQITQEEEKKAQELAAFLVKRALVPTWSVKNLNPQRLSCAYFTEEDLKRGYRISSLQADPVFKENFLTRVDYNALTLYQLYLNNQKKMKEEPLFVPYFINPEIKQNWDRCERERLWSFKGENNKSYFCDFKILQTRLLNFLETEDVKPYYNCDLNASKIQDTLDAFNDVSQVSWPLVLPSVYCKRQGQVVEVGKSTLSPCIPSMWLLQEVQQDPLFLEKILENLAPVKAERSAILAGEMQFYDLHNKNVGLTSELTSDQQIYLDKYFYLPAFSTWLTFPILQRDYLLGNLENACLVSISSSPLLPADNYSTIEELPDLKKALNAPWQWVFFDNENCLVEGNQIHVILKNSQVKSLIPFQSCFLALDWKDKPLDPQVIEELMVQTHQENIALKKWVFREDAPIYQRLSRSTIDQVKTLLVKLLPDYSLSKQKLIINSLGLIREVQEQFAHDLTHSSLSIHQEIWNLIEKDLRKFEQDIKKPYPQSRYEIAKQLFPRLTWLQYKAWFERQTALKNYLDRYQNIHTKTKNLEVLIVQIQTWIDSSLYSSLKKESHQIRLDKIKKKKKLRSIQQFKDEIIEECQPTYFNLMKVFYPLLADACELAKFCNIDLDRIGNQEHPLEDMLEIAKKDSKEEIRRFALNFEQRTKQIKEPPIFYQEFKDFNFG